MPEESAAASAAAMVWYTADEDRVTAEGMEDDDASQVKSSQVKSSQVSQVKLRGSPHAASMVGSGGTAPTCQINMRHVYNSFYLSANFTRAPAD